jgi:hypothetical protein
MTLLTTKTCIAIAALCVANLASAATYSNTSVGGMYGFGSLGTTSFGETFSTSGGILSDWSFYARSGNAGNVQLVVANWNGSYAVGPALFTSAISSYSGGAQALSFSNMNTTLAAGNYIAYLTVAGVVNPASQVSVGISMTNGGLGGRFEFLNSGGTDPLTLQNNWDSSGLNLNFSATITPVPEPETYGMMLMGLGLVGCIARRRKDKQA